MLCIGAVKSHVTQPGHVTAPKTETVIMGEILASSGFVLRHTLISMFVKFFLDLVSIVLLRITITRGEFGQILPTQ